MRMLAARWLALGGSGRDMPIALRQAQAKVLELIDGS